MVAEAFHIFYSPHTHTYTKISTVQYVDLFCSRFLDSCNNDQIIAVGILENDPADIMPLLTNWGRVMHIFVYKLTTIGSHNGLSPGRCQAIICNNVGILLIGHPRNNLQLNFNGKSYIFIQEIWKCRLQNGGHFVSASVYQFPCYV